jgi:hypothetical protein
LAYKGKVGKGGRREWKEEGGGTGDNVEKSDLKKKRKEFSGKVGIRGIGAASFS